METCRVPIPKDLPVGASRPILAVKRLNEIICYAMARGEHYEFELEKDACEALTRGELRASFTFDGETPVAIVLKSASRETSNS
ncbi:MAG: hypothetical protein JO053_04195 [Acidobacteria bacterium]|nr:hypothetical protein [Acidobacteriota bacterium]